jgi:hypothetical protein
MYFIDQNGHTLGCDLVATWGDFREHVFGSNPGKHSLTLHDAFGVWYLWLGSTYY